MVARLLHRCGLYLGPDQDLMPPGPDNPNGYWENVKFVELNTEILHQFGAGWDHPPSIQIWANENTETIVPHLTVKAENLLQEFRSHDPWGWKDPRTSLLFPFWLRLLPDLKIIVCLRNPLEVALSLHHRNYLSYSLGLTLWKTYNQRILTATQPAQCLITHYDAYFHNPQAELERVVDFLQIPASEETLKQATAEIDADLHHNRFTTRHLLDCDVASDIFKLYIQLCTLAQWPPDEESRRVKEAMLPRQKRNLVEALVAEEDDARGTQQLNKPALEAELLRREVASRNATIQALQRQNERDQQEREKLSESLNELTNEAELLRREVAQRDTAIQELQGQNEEVQQERSREVASRNATIQALQNQNVEIQQEREQLSESLNKLTTEAELLHREVASRNATIQALQDQILETNQEHEELSKSVNELTSKFHRVLDNTNLVQAQLQELKVELFYGEVEQQAEYSELQQDVRIQEVVQTTLPDAAVIIVVDHEDTALLNLTGCSVLPFSQVVDGIDSCGSSPDNGAIIAHLEALRSMGGQFLLLPVTQFHWLSQYGRFKRYLEERYQVITNQEDVCIIFDVRKPADPVGTGGWTEFEEMNSKIQRHSGRYPAILDWHTGLDLASKFPQYAVFSPPNSGDSRLPYLDHSVEVVAVPSSDSAANAEAVRVAQVAVISFRTQSDKSTPACTVTWLEKLNPELPTVSIIIPSYNKIAYVKKCVLALQETLPLNFRGEIVVVDDASTDETAARLDELGNVEKRLKVVTITKNGGFILACNRGAEVAAGEIIIFLNNDTLPLPGWFQPLLKVFRDYPDAGAVGGKLIYPDGRLQEAGCVTFCDGSAFNFGKGDYRVDDPLYNYVREVDYCSGALLATKRSLFTKLGGFDTHYCPAYYEDADYCFNLRTQGYRVYFQPESSVIHLEGISQGTDLSDGIKQYQTINQNKFKERWNHILKQYPPPPGRLDATTWHTLADRTGLLETSLSTPPKRALVVAPLMPEYDRESGSRRVYHIIEFLRKDGWSVSFVAQNGNLGGRYARLLQQQGVAVYTGFNSRIDQLIAVGQFDLAVLTFWYVGEFYLDKLRHLSPSTRVIIASIDLHFLRNARHIFSQTSENQNGQLDSNYAANTVREINTYAAADAVLAVSQKEADLINDLTSDSNLAYAVPLSEDLEPSPLSFTERKGILFIGNFRHPPNVEAVAYLCRDIVPKLDPALLAEHPIYIVGNALDETVRDYAQDLPQVKMIGWVPSLLPYLQQARITIVPLLHGAGTKGKLIQALFVGTPSVSTTIGIEGLKLRDKEHILVADNSTDFAGSISRLLTDAELWRYLAQRGQEHIRSIHDKEAVQKCLRDVIAAVLGKESKIATRVK